MKKKIALFIGILVLFMFIGVAWAAITASWDAPTTGGPVESYNLYYYKTSDGEGSAQKIEGITSTRYAFDETILDYETEYTFYVTAQNAAGEGGKSNFETYIRPLEPPGACSNFNIQ